jgi:4-amino-4-deoxy-L-arabinose transferase-like glycosyltransferase
MNLLPDIPAEKVERFFMGLAIVLAIPALLINLGVMANIDDEGIRSLVALEMDLSGNFIVPTMHGAYYYNKPPLYNWILWVFFSIFGNFEEFSARLVTVLSLGAYAATVYYFFKKEFSKKTAFLAAFMLITCGRFLFYDSMLGLIDTCFSWVIFTLFMWVWTYFKKEAWWKLFIGVYVLTSLAFLMKGLPALVFTGFTLLAWFIYNKRFWKLLSLPHFAGLGILMVMVGSYYLAYHQYNDLLVVFKTLFNESSKRTVIEFGWQDTVIHFFTFPFEQVYHFLPWSLFVIFLFQKGMFQKLKAQPFVVFLSLMFLVNILVYWSSVQVYPRYLLMFPPLVFGVFLFAAQSSERNWRHIGLEYLVGGVFSVLFIAAWVPLFTDELAMVSGRWWKSAIVSILLLGLTLAFWKYKEQRWLVFVSVLLTIRLAFDWYVIPHRLVHDRGSVMRMSCTETMQQNENYDWKVWDGTQVEQSQSFYLTRARKAIIPIDVNGTPDENAVYIVEPNFYLENYRLDSLGRIEARHGASKYLKYGRIVPIN